MKEKKRQALISGVLWAVFGLLLGGYFWSSYRGDQTQLTIEEKMLTPHDELSAIHLGSSGHGWMVGKYGLILHTKDGGKSWKEQGSRTYKALTAASFADDRHGFVVGSGGSILATTDGGLSWRAQNYGTKDHLLGVQAVGPTRAYVAGSFGTMLSTSDGGVRWRKHEVPWEKLIPRLIKETGYMEPNLNALHFISPDIGWVVGEFGLILHTRDGGQSWISQRYGSDLPQLYAVKFLTDNTGWALGQGGVLLRTPNGGKSWESIELGMKKHLYSMSLEGERGVIVGDGIVLTTIDGGSSWKRIGPIPENLWLGGVAMKSRQAIAVGQAGTIRLIEIGG